MSSQQETTTASPETMDFASMVEQTMKPFTEGEGAIVEGTVIAVQDNNVIIDIGYKSEGILPVQEFDDPEEVQVGMTVSVMLVDREDEHGMVVLSKQKADEKLHWEAVLEKYQEGSEVEGAIMDRVRGGLTVRMDGIDAFLPGSQIDVSPVHDPQPYIGNTYRFKVLKINGERRNVIVSRRLLIEEEQAEKKRELLDSIEVGQQRSGKVKNITDFGAFIDLDGLDGLLHITDMSWGRIKHPSDMLKVGDEINVAILSVNQERERVSLGLKQTQPNPWDAIEQRFPTGSRLRGKVVNLVPYGAFVEIEPGLEGLVHVSEFSWTKRVARPSDMLSVGEEVDVVVLSVNREDQKIGLGIRQTTDNPWDTVQERYPAGTRISGKARNFTNYGAFVELEDGIDGMVHVSDMSWTRKINHPNEMLKKGEKVEAIVLEVDPQNQRISLGIKQASDDPWTSIGSRFKVGDVVKGKVSKLASFGAFVDLEDGIDGLVHVSQISDEHVEKVKDSLQVGQEVEARIVKIDRNERRIGLSIKAMRMSEEELAEMAGGEEAEDLKPGEKIVGLANAFDQAFAQGGEEWRPGQDRDEAGQETGDEKPAEQPVEVASEPGDETGDGEKPAGKE